MQETQDILVKGRLMENGDVIISLGEDGYLRILSDYIDAGIVETSKL